MADTKLSALTEATATTAADELYINDGGLSKRITAANAGVSLLANAGVSASVEELNHVDGVTSAIQTQLNAKAATASLGTAAAADLTTSATDTTAGRVTRVGDFGLGAAVPPLTTDLDSLTVTGFYYTEYAVPGLPEYGFMVQHLSRSTDGYAVQIATSRDGSASPVIYVRQEVGYSWSGWNKQYGENNILGTVSQSAGVPTGAIIESGSNANGYYVKYADGTMICRFMGTTAINTGVATGSLFYNLGIFTFPVAFVSTTGLVVTGVANGNNVWSGSAAVTSTDEVTIRLFSTSSGLSSKLGYVAHGRWF